MDTYKILHIIGARPHFMKLAPISNAIQNNPRLNEVVVHSGQHYDYHMSGSFFKEFELMRPKYNLEIGSSHHLIQMGNILLGLDQILNAEAPDIVFVYGDTNTTAAGAIAAAKLNIPIAHIEAGLREFDKRIPEEVNKLLVDSVSDLFFSPTESGVTNLAKAGITEHVVNSGDVVVDYLQSNIAKIANENGTLEKLGVQAKDYYLLTCHRLANTDTKSKLQEILKAALSLDKKVVFLIHPRTRKSIYNFDLESYLDHENIIISEPIGFWNTQLLILNAKMVITDSGGLIKESYVHKTPCIIIDTQTEWIETVATGWAIIVGPVSKNILSSIELFKWPIQYPKIFGDGESSKTILNYTIKYLDQIKE